jgi:hypothetical protein
MELIEIWTLIDVTHTGATRPNQGSQLQIDQHRNFITLRQCVELRSVVYYDELPSFEKVDIKGLGFGSAYKGKQLIWKFKFSPDRVGVYVDDRGNSIGFLLDDIHGVPVIKNLTETVNIDKAVFDTKDSVYKNTIIKALSGST